MFEDEFGNRLAGTLDIMANIANAQRVTQAMIDDINSIAYGHTEYLNNNTAFYQGGYYVLTARVGSRLGGYQEVQMLLNVADRTILEIEGNYDDNGNWIEYITPYGGLNGSTDTPDGTISVTYVTGEKGTLNALWSYANIDYHYMGSERQSYVLIGNTQGGYQTVAVNIKVESRVVSGMVPLNEDGREFVYNPFDTKGVLPTYVDVYFNGDNANALRLSVDKTDGFKLTKEYKAGVGELKALIRIGNDRSGYQWMECSIKVDDRIVGIDRIALDGEEHNGTVYETVSAYSNPLTVDSEGRILLNGKLLQVKAYIANSLSNDYSLGIINEKAVWLYARLISDFEYDYSGINGITVLKIAIGNDIGGFITQDMYGNQFTLSVKVDAEIIDKVEGIRQSGALVNTFDLFEKYFTAPSFNPHESIVMDDERIMATLTNGKTFDAKYGLTVKDYAFVDEFGNIVDYKGNSNARIVLYVGNDKGGYQAVYLKDGKDYRTVKVDDMSINIEAISGEFKTDFDPYTDTLPEVISYNGYDYKVTYLCDGRPFDGSEISYYGGKYQLTARIGSQKGGYQEYKYTLNVSQKLISSIDGLDMAVIDQFSANTLPEGLVSVTFTDGTTAVFEIKSISEYMQREYTLDIIASNNDLVFTDTVISAYGKSGLGLYGGWDLTNVNLSLDGGIYYATLYIGNDNGKYQPVAVPIEVKTKQLSQKEAVQYVVSKDGDLVSTAPLNDITVGFGEYFVLPNDLWLSFSDGTSFNTTVVWDRLAWSDKNGVHTLTEWSVSDLFRIENGNNVYGKYTLYANAFNRTVSVNITVSEDRMVVSDSFSDYYSIRRGQASPLPNEMHQTVYDANSGTIEISRPFKVIWNNIPSLSIEDSYLLTANMDGQGIMWSKEITLHIYSSSISSVSSIVGGDIYTVGQGSIMTAFDMPKIEVIVKYGKYSVKKRISANWMPLTKTVGEAVTDISTIDTNSFNISALDVGARYTFKAIIIGADGSELMIDGKAITVDYVVIDSDDISTKITLNTNAVDNDGNEYIQAYYGDGGIEPFKLLSDDVKVVSSVFYSDESRIEIVSENEPPREVGRYYYEVTVTYKNIITEYVKSLSCIYVVDKTDISSKIVVSDTNVIYNGESQGIKAYVSGRIADLEILYLVGDTWTENAPKNVGTYTVKINVVSPNYGGEIETELSIVKAVQYNLYGESGEKIGETYHSGVGRFISLPNIDLPVGVNEYASYAWYYVDTQGVKHSFKASDRITENMCSETGNGPLELNLYMAVLRLKIVSEKTLTIDKIITVSGNDGGNVSDIYSLITVDIFNPDTEIKVGQILFIDNSSTIIGDFEMGKYLDEYRLVITMKVGNSLGILTNGENGYIELKF